MANDWDDYDGSCTTMGSDVSHMLTELLGRSSEMTRQTTSVASSKDKQNGSSSSSSSSLSAHLTKCSSFRNNDRVHGERSVFTRDSDLSGLLSELLAPSVVLEDDEDDEDDKDEGRMPLLNEDEEYSCIEPYNTDFTLNTSELPLNTSGPCESCDLSDITGMLSDMLSSATPTISNKSVVLDKYGLRFESKPQPMQQSISDLCDDAKKNRPYSLTRDGKKSQKKSKRKKQEPKLKKKASSKATTKVYSNLAPTEEEKEWKLNMTTDLARQIKTSKRKGEKGVQKEKVPASPDAFKPTQRFHHPGGLGSPTSVHDATINPHFSAWGNLDSPIPKPPLHHNEADVPSNPSSQNRIFPILSESVQHCILSLHQQWLMTKSQNTELPFSSIPMDSEEKSVTSDISGLTSVFQGVSSKTSAPTLQYPCVHGEYRDKTVDGESDGVTSVWYRKKADHPPKPPSRPYRKVAFTTVHVRDYESILGDNPSCHDGPGIGIGWQYKKERVYGIDVFDAKPGRRHGEELLLTREEREATLLKLGYTRKQLTGAILARLKIKHERQQTSAQNTQIQGFHEIIAGAGRQMNRLVANLEEESGRH